MLGKNQKKKKRSCQIVDYHSEVWSNLKPRRSGNSKKKKIFVKVHKLFWIVMDREFMIGEKFKVYAHLVMIKKDLNGQE